MLKFFKVSFKHILWLMSALVLFVIAINLWVLSYSPIDEVGRVLPREYALLLGTSKFTKSGMVNPYYRYRIVAASELYLSGKVKKIIASGTIQLDITTNLPLCVQT